MDVKSLAGALARAGLGATATAVLGPGAVAALGRVATVLKTAPTPEAIEVALASDPDALAKLVPYEVELAKIAAADRADARKAFGGHWMTWTLTLVLVAMWAIWRGVLVWAAAAHIPLDETFVANTLGTLDYLVIGAVSFWLGSSLGSAAKGQVIESGVRR